MNYFPRRSAFALSRTLALAFAVIVLALLSGCSALRPTPVAPQAYYALLGEPSSALPVQRSAMPGRTAAPTLLVNPPLADPGFDSQRIIYRRQAYRLEYFAHSEWVEPPARMLAPLIVAALERSGSFRAVLTTPGAALADLRLDTEIVRLQHEFGVTPSRVRLTLRATLSDYAKRQVIAQVELEELVHAPSDDAYGGVVAANQATHLTLQALAAFCSQAALAWPTRTGNATGGAVGRF